MKILIPAEDHVICANLDAKFHNLISEQVDILKENKHAFCTIFTSSLFTPFSVHSMDEEEVEVRAMMISDDLKEPDFKVDNFNCKVFKDGSFIFSYYSKYNGEEYEGQEIYLSTLFDLLGLSVFQVEVQETYQEIIQVVGETENEAKKIAGNKFDIINANYVDNSHTSKVL